MCAKAVEDEQRGSIEEGEGSWTPNFLTPHSHSVSIHPSFVCGSGQPHHWGGFLFCIVFLLKMTIGFSFLPDSEHARKTMKPVFSWPAGYTGTLSAPVVSTILEYGASNDIGTSSMLKTRSACMASSSFRRETNWRKFVTFSSQFSGSFWPTVVLERTDRRFRCINLLYQFGPPTKSATFVCFTNSLAFREIMTVVTAWPFSLWITIHSFNVLSNARNLAISARQVRCVQAALSWKLFSFASSRSRISSSARAITLSLYSKVST